MVFSPPSAIPNRNVWMYNGLLRKHGINAVVTCEIKLFQNYFSLRRRPIKIILYQRVETYLKLFQNLLDSLCWFSQRRSPTPHFWGCAPSGLWPPNSNSAEIFVQCTYPQSFIACIYSFGSYHVDKQTNIQTDAAENIQRSSLRYDVGWLFQKLIATHEYFPTRSMSLK